MRRADDAERHRTTDLHVVRTCIPRKGKSEPSELARLKSVTLTQVLNGIHVACLCARSGGWYEKRKRTLKYIYLRSLVFNKTVGDDTRGRPHDNVNDTTHIEARIRRVIHAISVCE